MAETLGRVPEMTHLSTSTVTAPSQHLSDSGSPVRVLRLFFSGRDLPEPDSRSRISYAVVYHAQEAAAVPSGFSPNIRLDSVGDLEPGTTTRDSSATKGSTPSITPPSTPPRVKSTPGVSVPRQLSVPTRHHSPKSARPSAASPPSKVKSKKAPPSPMRLVARATAGKDIQRTSRMRAPQRCEEHTAPSEPEVFETKDGTTFVRSPWTKIGCTELARKHGRDVEFARSFTFHYVLGSNQVIRVAFFDCTSRKVEKQRLIGTAQLRVASVFAAKGKPVSFPLKFFPVSRKDMKRSSRIPDGTLVVAAEHILRQPTKYCLHVECNKIMRAKALTSAAVKKTFFTVHAVLDEEPGSDNWTLMYRSEPVEMIHRKRDGGSLEYNYFSSTRLKAGPGIIVEDRDEKDRKKLRPDATGVGRGNPTSDTVLSRVGNAMGIKQKELFFSLPGADLQLKKDTTPLKLSLFEDNGLLSGFDLIADTEFSMAELKTRELGQSSPIRIHANTVGKAVLKYVECSPDPTYFCMSLMVQGLR